MAPDVAPAREQAVDQRDGQREERERPQEAVRPEQLELDEPGARSHQRAEQDASGSRVGRRLRIRDHEEREEHERAALEAMERNAERLSEPERPRDEESRVGHEEGHGHVAPGRAVHDQAARRGEQEAEHGRAAPLSGRDPHVPRAEHHRHQREVRGIEDVLALYPQHELARDGDRGRDDRNLERIGPEQQTEREPRDQGASRVEEGEFGQARREPLHQQDGREDGDGVENGQIEAEPDQAVGEEASEGRDLVHAGITPAPGFHAL
jgi:hypothetical protein